MIMTSSSFFFNYNLHSSIQSHRTSSPPSSPLWQLAKSFCSKRSAPRLKMKNKRTKRRRSAQSLRERKREKKKQRRKKKRQKDDRFLTCFHFPHCPHILRPHLRTKPVLKNSDDRSKTSRSVFQKYSVFGLQEWLNLKRYPVIIYVGPKNINI